MAVYLTFYLIVILLCLLQRKLNQSLRVFSQITIFSLLFLFSAVRGSAVGSDTPNYVILFERSSSVTDAALSLLSVEPAFVLLLFVLRSITDSPTFFIAIYSAIQVYILFLVFKNTKRNYTFLLAYTMLFYLNLHFNTIRVGLAVLLLLLFLSKDQGNKKYVWAILAPLFHVSILFLYPFFVFRVTFRSAIYVIIGCSIVVLFMLDWVSIFYYKMFSYEDYLSLAGVNPLLPLLIIFYIFISMILTAPANGKFKNASYALILSYLLLIAHPVAYRIVFLAQIFYFYFMLQTYNGGWLERRKVYFFWPLLILLFAFNLTGIYKERANLDYRINSGELHGEAAESSYIPYKLFWE